MHSAPIQPLLAASLVDQLRHQAHALGFDLVGIAPADPSRHADYFRQWLADGKAASMHYLARRFDERVNLRAYMPGAASVICVAMNYFAPLAELPPGHGRIARYALGDDYHERMKRRLHQLADWLRRHAPDAVTRCCVDTAPVLERELAARAGIGWIGKNTCMIHPRMGSWLLLGEIITTLALPADQPITDHCGTCTRCIDACPTQAIVAPYQLDASRCISYLTIENSGEIPASLQGSIGAWLFGCDICQEVCPHNSRAPSISDPALQPRFASGSLDVAEISDWTIDQYRQTLRGSAMKRVKLPVLQRNAQIVRENHRGSSQGESVPAPIDES